MKTVDSGGLDDLQCSTKSLAYCSEDDDTTLRWKSHLLSPHPLACWKKVLFAIKGEKNKDGGEGKHGSILVSFMNIPSMDPALKRVECLYKDIQKT